mmetsp:Transcript_727/g.1704  ORF Transcript_727/g.1704 Transcript_727/m.1704 type:complete len:108 (-) Transcript_727:205-528(-)|eukprot:CAMPEP_0116824466 /NCGR_PEP_ID=MMETSP0418-20121206/1413_1 /TAXON_ID=1158023 /ORGANISM="Astrosyne radiata, Strain 13vi08-1A" /LENGTH=107 /DNA_ID=CAMNT_0004452841 /DNA_START=52 /DNA_END=375 /DNA_ORIENTATION=+
MPVLPGNPSDREHKRSDARDKAVHDALMRKKLIRKHNDSLSIIMQEPKTPKEQGPSKSNTATKREKFVETSNPSGKDEAVRNDLMRKNMVRAHNDSVALMMVEPTKK